MAATFLSPAPPPTDYLTTDELAAGRFELIAIDKLRESPLNPRKHFDQHKLIELADSIRRQGIITPLLVRPVQYLVGPGYEIAAGHRRYRAAQEAGLEYVPCIVREMADDAFLEVLVIENVQREDVHPLEEAEGYQKLLAGRYDAAAIAAKIGKTEAYVYGRLELLELVEVVRGSFFRGDITIGHARQIARLDVKRQEEALRACFRRNWHTQREELVAAADLKRWIRDNAGGKDLAKAPFELSDASLGAPACHECPQAAGVNPLLVDPDGDKTCLDPKCFDQKVTTLIEKRTSAGVVAISTSYSPKDAPAGVIVSQEYAAIHTKPDDEDLDQIQEIEREIAAETDPERIKGLEQELQDLKADMAEHETPCEFAEPAIVVHGYGEIGESKTICRNPECPVHGKRLRLGGGGDSARDVEKAKREQEARKLKDKARIAAREEALRQVSDLCWEESMREQLRDALAHHFINRTNNREQVAAIARLYDLNLPKKFDYGEGPKLLWKGYQKLANPDRNSFLARVLLTEYVGRHDNGYSYDALSEISAALKIDLKKIEAGELRALKADVKGKAAKKAAKEKRANTPKQAEKSPTENTAKTGKKPGKRTSSAESVADSSPDAWQPPPKPDEKIEFFGVGKKKPNALALADIRIWKHTDGLYLTVGISLPTKGSEGFGKAGPLHVDGKITFGGPDDPDFLWVNRAEALRTAYAVIAGFCRNDVPAYGGATDATRKAAKQVLAWVEQQVQALEVETHG